MEELIRRAVHFLALFDWQTVAIVITASVAIWGVNTWRREFLFKKKFELVEDVLSSVYQARDALNEIRWSLSLGGEGKTRPRAENETPEVTRLLDMAFIPMERYKLHSALFSHVYSLKYRFMTYFGSAAVTPFHELQVVVNSILISARALGDYWVMQAEGASSEEIGQEIRKHRKTIYQSGSDDEIAKKADKIVSDIESACSNVIKRVQK